MSIADFITCHACGGRIRERADDVVLSPRADRTAPKMFFHSDLMGSGECDESSGGKSEADIEAEFSTYAQLFELDGPAPAILAAAQNDLNLMSLLR